MDFFTGGVKLEQEEKIITPRTPRDKHKDDKYKLSNKGTKVYTCKRKKLANITFCIVFINFKIRKVNRTLKKLIGLQYLNLHFSYGNLGNINNSFTFPF